MEPLRLKPRKPVEGIVENWDDDDFFLDGHDLTLRSASTTTNALSRRRDLRFWRRRDRIRAWRVAIDERTVPRPRGAYAGAYNYTVRVLRLTTGHRPRLVGLNSEQHIGTGRRETSF